LKRKKLTLLSDLILSIILFFVVLELCLQTLAFFPHKKLNSKLQNNFQQNSPHLRILALGDSTTALGANESYSILLQKMLRAKYPHLEIDIINKAMVGATLQDLIQYTPQLLTQTRPDVVILMAGINDEMNRDDLVFVKSKKSFLRHLKSLKLFSILKEHLIYAHKNIFFPDFTPTTQSWDKLWQKFLAKRSQNLQNFPSIQTDSLTRLWAKEDIKHFDTYLSNQRVNPIKNWQWKTKRYLLEKNHQKAKDYLESIANQIAPQDFFLYEAQILKIYHSMGNKDKLEEHLKIMKEKFTLESSHLSLLTQSLIEIGRANEGIDFLKKQLKKNPLSYHLKVQLWWAIYQLSKINEDNREQTIEYQNLLLSEAKHHTNKIWTLASLGQWAQLSKKSPQLFYKILLNWLDSDYFKSEDFISLYQYFPNFLQKQILKTDLNSLETWALIENLNQNLDSLEIEKRITPFLSQKSDHDFRAQSMLASLYYNQGKTKKSLKIIHRLLIQNPYSLAANNLLIMNYAEEKKFAQALLELKKILTWDKDNPTWWKMLGSIYEAKDDSLLAQQFYKKSLALEKKRHAHLSLFWGTQNWQQAREKNATGVKKLLLGHRDQANIYFKWAEEIFNQTTPWQIATEYKKLAKLITDSGALLLAVQYPLRPISYLKNLLQDLRTSPQIIFVENKKNFLHSLELAPDKNLFVDKINIDFGHCTVWGNNLIASQIFQALDKFLQQFELARAK